MVNDEVIAMEPNIRHLTLSKRFICKVGHNGRMTIPKGVRKALGIQNTNLIECVMTKIEVEENAM